MKPQPSTNTTAGILDSQGDSTPSHVFTFTAVTLALIVNMSFVFAFIF